MQELYIVETRDAVDHTEPARMAELAAGMSRIGVPATLFLAENGAFAARLGHQCPLDEALAAGVQVAVDGFALDERGIGADQLRDGISVEGVDRIVDALERGATVMWR
jgi:predicted peroxiredoxin